MANLRYTNLPSRDLSVNTEQQSAEIKTKVFFNGYFDQEVNISGVEWDIVYSFTKTRSDNDEAARALAEAIITTAVANDDSITDLVTEMKRFDDLQLTNILALYFNESRRETSLLGFTQTLTPNKYVSRNINA